MRKTSLLFQVLFVGIALAMIALTAHALSSGNFVNPDRSPATAAPPSRVQTNVNQFKPTGQQLIKPSGDENVELRDDEVIPSIGFHLSGKMDVALAIGKESFADGAAFSGKIISLDFDQELRAWFNGPSDVPGGFTAADRLMTTEYFHTPNDELWEWAKEKYGPDAPMLPNRDLYINSSEMSTLSMSSTFPWWVYDHSYPQNSAIAKTDHANHKYYEFTNQNFNTNPPYTQSYLDEHIILDNNGATLRFEGYHIDGYCDFAYLENDDPNRKIIEYGVQEDGSAHAFGGNGFFFNCKINDGTYGNAQNPQRMSGYLLYFHYKSNDQRSSIPGFGTKGATGRSMHLYKFENVNTQKLHQTGDFQSTPSIGIFPFADGTWTCLAQSNLYNLSDDPDQDHPSRRIKIEIDPQYVRVWHNASKAANSKIVDTPFADYQTASITYPALFKSDPDEHLVKVGTGWQLFNGTQQATVEGGIVLDSNFDPGYGFGPMASYDGHHCSQQTVFTIKNLTMSMGSVRRLHEVVADPRWHDNTERVLVNLNLQEIIDFSKPAMMGDLLSRVINDNVYYIGWCSTENLGESQQFADASNPKGTLINVADNYVDDGNASTKNDPVSDASRNLQMKIIAQAIYDVWYKANVDNRVLVTDDVNFTVSPEASGANTADPDWPDGKWKFIHKTAEELGWNVETTDGANSTTHPDNNKRLSNLDIDFTYPGEYDIYYRDVMIKTITAHRKPVAQFNVNMADLSNPEFIDAAKDPDDLSADGIKQKEWKWTDLTLPSGDPNASGTGTPSSLTPDHVYLIELTVTDKWDATATTAKTLKPTSNPTQWEASMAQFELTPVTFIKNLPGQRLTIADHSYDDYGRNFEYAWDSPTSNLINQLGINLTAPGIGDYEVPSLLPVGEYKIELIVTEQATHVPSIRATRTFWVIEDNTPPIATVDKSPASYQGYTTITLTFEDVPVFDDNSKQSVMSGFERQWVCVSATPISDPCNDISDWGAVSTVNNRAVNLPVGDSYVYWKAVDKVGNEACGEFGEYTVTKIPTSVTLTPDPAMSVIYGGVDGVKLTAVLPNSINPYDQGVIEFFMDGTKIGDADIIRGIDPGDASGKIYTAYAVLKAIPDRAALPPVKPLMKFEVKFKGDKIHGDASESIDYQVDPNPDATIKIALTLGVGVDSKVYDGAGILTPNVTVVYPAGGDTDDYAIEYSGNQCGDETKPYAPSATSPANVGVYKAKAHTTDPNYEVKYDSVDFFITPRPVTVEVTPAAGSFKTNDPVLFTATIGNLVDAPAGTVTFSLDGDVVATGIGINYTSGATGTATWTWPSATGGSHAIMAEFVPDPSCSNYASNIHSITYDIGKAVQAPLEFVYEGTPNPVPDVDLSDMYDGQTQIYANAAAVSSLDTIKFGDSNFKLEAIGGTGTGAISYEVISQNPNGGSACVDFNPYTQVARIIGAGEFRVRATKAADLDYNATDTVLLVKIARAPGLVAVNVDDVDYKELIQPVITQNLSGGNLTYSYIGALKDGSPYGPLGTAPTEAGDYALIVTSAQTANYEEAISALELFEIKKLPQTIVLHNDGDTTLWTTDTTPFFLPVTGGAGNGGWTWSSNNPSVADFLPTGEIELQSGVTAPATAIITVQKAGDNNYNASNTLQFTINVAYEPTDIDLGTLAPDFANAGYRWEIQATTGTPPYQWNVQNLPPGMRADPNSSNGEILIIQGTPDAVFDDNVIISVTNNGGFGVTEVFNVPMKVYPAPTASTDNRQYVELHETMVVTYPIPMDITHLGTVTVNGRSAVGYWQSDGEFVISPPRDGYDYNTEYTVVISGLKDAKGAITHYRQVFTFRTGALPPPPVVSRIVTILPLPEGVTSNPAPEVEHVILSGEDFFFTLTVSEDDQWEPVAVTNRKFDGVVEKLKGTRIDDTNVFQFVVRQVRHEYLEISITLEPRSDDGTGNEIVGAETKLWSNGGKLYVETSHDGVLSAYTMTGELCLQEFVAGSGKFTLPHGVYIVKIHGKAYKVMIH